MFLLSRMPRRRVVTWLICGAIIALIIYVTVIWDRANASTNIVAIYFGKPSDVLAYIASDGRTLLASTAICGLIALSCLVLSFLLTICLLTLGLLTDGIKSIERIAAVTQTIPTLVVVTVSLLLQRQIFSVLEVQPSAAWYCLLPVTAALMFPPLANGAAAIRRCPLQLKGLLRVWRIPRRHRIFRIYLPLALPEVLTGVRASATWAVGATLLAEGLFNGIAGDNATLGHYLMLPFAPAQPGRTLAVILVATILGFCVYYISVAAQQFIERRLHGREAFAESTYAIRA